MKIVDISDIEDIVLAKYEIDQNDPNCEGRSNLQDFMVKYCSLTDVLVINEKLLSFKYEEVFNKKYLFIDNKNHSDVIVKFLSSINYNFNNLIEIPMIEYINNSEKYFIHNNRYYKVK